MLWTNLNSPFFTDSVNDLNFSAWVAACAAAEVAVGLALIVALYRKRQTAHVEDLTLMKL